jgi:hypothetical protein
MKMKRSIGCIAAVLICAALLCIPGALAAGQEMPDGQDQGGPQGQHGGSDQGPGQAPGGQQNQGQTNGQGGMARPEGGGNGPSGSDGMAGNATERQGPPPGNFGNMTGNETAPGQWDAGNMTAFNEMARHGPGNMTFCNATDGNDTPCQPFDGNATQAWGNESFRHQYGDNSTMQFRHEIQAGNGNETGNAPSANGNAADRGSAQGQGSGQNSGQNQKDADLIAAFLAWLNGK